MIVEISEMIDYLEQFVRSSEHESVVGGVAGTQIEKFVLEVAQTVTSFQKILVLNGVQDYIGLLKKPMSNVKYFYDLFVEEIVDSLNPTNPWLPKIYNPSIESVFKINTTMLTRYDVIVVFNSHMIRHRDKKTLSDNFGGKIIWIYDPFDLMGRSMSVHCNSNIPVIVDTLEKVSPMIAMARATFGFETRAVDRRVPGTFTEISKLSNRSIGKMDDKQYVTNDYQLIYEINQRQVKAPFRKNQKVIIDDDRLISASDNDGRTTNVTADSLLVIQSPGEKHFMKHRVYNSKMTCSCDITYNKDKILTKRHEILVKPANIVSPINVAFHRFNHIVFINTYDEDFNQFQKYTILKNANNVTIVQDKKEVMKDCLDIQ